MRPPRPAPPAIPRSLARALPLLGALFAAPLAAQDAAPVPVGEEPLHRVVLVNERVRVLDVVLPPGRTTLYHVHDRDNVPVAVAAGRTTVQPLGGDVRLQDVALGRVTFAAGGYTHRVTNVGPTEMHYIDVELLGPPRPGAAGPASVPPRHELVLQNDRVRAWRVVLAPGERLPAHAHAGPSVHVTVRGGTPGSFRWMPAGEAMGIANDGDGPFEMVEVELLE